MTQRKFYTIPEAAEILRIPPGTLYRHAREGRLAHLNPIRIGNSTRIPVEAITPKEAAS